MGIVDQLISLSHHKFSQMLLFCCAIAIYATCACAYAENDVVICHVTTHVARLDFLHSTRTSSNTTEAEPRNLLV